MRTLLASLLIAASTSAMGMTLTKDFVVTRLKYNEAKKVYEVDFLNQAGVYKGDDKNFSCLQSSLKSNKPAHVTFDPMGLKITECTNK